MGKTVQGDLADWWYHNHPVQGSFERFYPRDCSFIVKHYLSQGGTEEEFQKLALHGWGHQDERTKYFTRRSIPCFIKEIPHLRQTFNPNFAWQPPEETRAVAYQNGAVIASALRDIAQKLVKPVDDPDARRREMMEREEKRREFLRMGRVIGEKENG